MQLSDENHNYKTAVNARLAKVCFNLSAYTMRLQCLINLERIHHCCWRRIWFSGRQYREMEINKATVKVKSVQSPHSIDCSNKSDLRKRYFFSFLQAYIKWSFTLGQFFWDHKLEDEMKNVFINDETLIAFFRFHLIEMTIRLFWRYEEYN